MLQKKLQKSLLRKKGSLWRIIPKVPNLIFNKKADLLRNILYTVIPINHEIKFGVFPDDQGFDKKRVLLWDNFDDLLKFPAEEFKMISVEIPPEVKRTDLRRLVGSAYSLPFIKNTWKIEVLQSPPLYIQ